MIRRLVRQALADFTAWRARKKLVRAIPQLAEIDREIEARRAKHQPIRRHLRAKRDLMLNQLAREQGRARQESTFG